MIGSSKIGEKSGLIHQVFYTAKNYLVVAFALSSAN